MNSRKPCTIWLRRNHPNLTLVSVPRTDWDSICLIRDKGIKTARKKIANNTGLTQEKISLKTAGISYVKCDLETAITACRNGPLSSRLKSIVVDRMREKKTYFVFLSPKIFLL